MYQWQNKRRSQVNHGDDWLITYADMITLLLCFFAIFLIVSAPKKNISQQPPKPQIVTKVETPPSPIVVPILSPLDARLPSVAPLTKAPDAFQGNLPFHDIDEADETAEESMAPPDMSDAPEHQASDAAPPSVSVPAPTPEAPKIEDAPAAAAQEPAPPSLSQIADNLKAQGSADFDPKSDRIKTFDISSAAFFDSGSATLSRAGADILLAVAGNLKSDQFKDYQITVEGHTDDTPIHTLQFPSNWELSTARASAVVHFFLEQGIPAVRLRAAGYADTFSKAPNRDEHGNPIPANQAQNRRVVIKLEKIEKN